MIHTRGMDDATEPINSAESEREEGELSNDDDEDEIIILSEVGHIPANSRQSLKQIYQNCVRNPADASLTSCKSERRTRALDGRCQVKREPSALGYPSPQLRRKHRKLSCSYSTSVSRSQSRSRSRDTRSSLKRSLVPTKEDNCERSRSVEILENNNTASPVKSADYKVIDSVEGSEDCEDKEDEELELRLAALHSVKVLKTEGSPARWKSTFTIVDQVDESEDEEMQLRLAALQSVKAKDDVKQETPPPSEASHDPEPVDADKQVVEDEDEELLRARLLIEVARRQTSVATKSSSLASKTTLVREESSFGKPLQEMTIPKLAPVVINLQHDSDSSDEDQFDFEASVNQLLRTARQNVEQNTKETVPKALSHLPKHQQEEYCRLKQEIVRRETMMQKKENEATGIPSDAAPVSMPEVQAPSPKKVKLAAKPSPLKSSILKKKRDMARVKTALTKQFEIVEKNRLEWHKDKEEVARLKQLLQQAEQKEQGSKILFSASQKMLFRLRNDLKSHEDQFAQFVKKVKVQKAKKVVAAQPTVEKLPTVPAATPLKVKPQIVAKALQKGTTPARVLPTSSKFAPGKFSHISLSSNQPLAVKKSKYEEWLFGILGEEWAVEEDSLGTAQSYRSPLYSIYAPLDRRLDPSATLCRYDVDQFCRDANCKFQHLPKHAVPKEAAGLSSSTSAKVFVTLPGGMSVVRKH